MEEILQAAGATVFLVREEIHVIFFLFFPSGTEVDEYRQAAAGMCLGFFIDANEKMMR